MSEHTPGPWDVTNDGRDDGRLTIHTRGEDVALVRSEANARLIAAAPDMLAALRYLRGAILLAPYENPNHDCSYEIAQIDAAIAKAEGR